MPRPGMRMNGRWRSLALLLLAVGSLATAGCLAVAVGGTAAGGTAAYVYFKGNVCQEYVASFKDTWQATLDALREQGLPLVKNENDGKKGKISSKTADDTTIHIDLETVRSRHPRRGHRDAGVCSCRPPRRHGRQRTIPRPGRRPSRSGRSASPAPGGVAGWTPAAVPSPIRPVSAVGPAETGPPPVAKDRPGQPVPIRVVK